MKRPQKQEFVIDLAGVRSSRSLQARLCKALPMPEDYGRNYDALYDVLTEYGPAWRIVFKNAQVALKVFRAVCADAQESAPGLEIVFA